MNQEFRKYLWYATGEILLVVIGILVALQIDAWYEDRQEKKRLDNYLNNIARTITDDLNRTEELEAKRAELILKAYQTILGTSGDDGDDPDWYNKALVQSASQTIRQVQITHNLAINTESFRALEASGLISSLENPELEFMLHEYYRTSGRIERLEAELNRRIGDLGMRFQTETTAEIPQIYKREPLLMWQTAEPDDPSSDRDELEVLQALYWQVLTDSTTHTMLRTPIHESLLQEYRRLLVIGQQIVNAIEKSPNEGDLGETDEARSTVAPQLIVSDGIPKYDRFSLGVAPSGNPGLDNVYKHIWVEDGALQVHYTGGSPWAYLYFRAGPVEIVVDRVSIDFSKYDQLELALKRDPATACSDLVLEIKDIEDAEREGLKSIPLAMAAEWTTYTFDLSRFTDADLSQLHVAAGFLITSQEPCRFAIQSIRYQSSGGDPN